MFEIVRQQLLEDQLRSDKIAFYSMTSRIPIWQSVQDLYDNYVKNYFTGDISDTTLAITISDGIYNQL